MRAVGKRLGKYTVKAGPCRNPQLMFVLADRALIYFHHMAGRSHGVRDNPVLSVSDLNHSEYPFLSRQWDSSRKKTASEFFSSVISGASASGIIYKKMNKVEKRTERTSEMEKMFREILEGISDSI